MRGSGVPNDSSSRSVRAVGILPLAVLAELPLNPDDEPSPIPCPPCIPWQYALRQRSVISAFLTVEGGKGGCTVIIGVKVFSRKPSGKRHKQEVGRATRTALSSVG